MCTPAGTECYQNAPIDPTTCLTPCKGQYADVLKDDNFEKVENMMNFKSTLASYESYKRGVSKAVEYPELMLSRFSFSKHFLYDFYSEYKEKENKLHWVRIFFNTPTFDRITKDEKANFEAKLSAIGGTMGLLTGFSIISGVEIVYFGIKIVIGCIRKLTGSRETMPSHVK